MSKELKLIPPNDPRVLSMIAPFSDDRLEAEGFKNRQELTDAMFLAMKKYGGIGLSANQVGLPFRYVRCWVAIPELERGMAD